MKKLLFTLLTFFILLYSNTSFAQTANTQNGLTGCWECFIIEGVYIYVFNFVYKMYDVLVPIIRNLLWLALAFWFLWYIWTNVIKVSDSGKTTDMLKDVFVKLLTYTFVISLLSLPAKTIFGYSTDIIMNAGPNFAKWVLTEARADTEMLKLVDGRMKPLSCDDIKLSSYATEALRNYTKSDAYSDDYNAEEETLTNLLCITREYTNTFNAGTNLGFNIMTRSVIAMGEYKAMKLTYDSAIGQGIETVIKTALGGFQWIYSLIMGFIKLWVFATFIVNCITMFIGLCITVGFLYILFTYLIIIFDVVIKLAMVGVMMPIAIGSWTFNNTRKRLSGALFFDVVKCTFRLGFLSVSMTISTYLLNKLLTTDFNAGSFGVTLDELIKYFNIPTNSVLDHTQGGGNIITASTFLDGVNLLSTKNRILISLLTNPKILISTLFVCLISYTLLSTSIQMADKFSSAIGKGVQKDQILNGLKKFTISSIRYITSGVERKELGTVSKAKWMQDKITYAGEKAKEKLLKKKQKKNEDITIYDLPVSEAINLYEEGNSLDESEIIDFENKESYASKSTEEVVEEYEDRLAEYTKMNEERRDFVDNKLEEYEGYKNLTEDEKSKVISAVISDDATAMQNLSGNKNIERVINKVQSSATPNQPNPFSQIKKDLEKHELKKYIAENKDLSDTQKQTFIDYVEKGTKLTPADTKVMEKFEQEVKSKNYKEAQRLKKMQSYVDYRKKLQRYNKNEITSKDMYLILKREEINSIIDEIDYELASEDITSISRIKVSQLKRKLAKAKKEVDAIEEYDDLIFDDLVDREIQSYKRRRSKRKSPRAQRENARTKNSKI